MPTTEQLRKKLLVKLTELFQLDQPELDFGFYRIMHAKATQVKEFIEKDLLKIVSDAFGQVDDEQLKVLQANYENTLQSAKAFGAVNPEETEPVKIAKLALDAWQESGANEADVYDHLYRFFERYYDQGDFISRRYYTKETAGKAAPFAIPYNGEEVKLHWANADQYYIKTAEYFSNYSFDITQASEIRNLSEEVRSLEGLPNTIRKIHFNIVEAAEGEHGNIKATEDKKRFFVLQEETPISLNELGELKIHFEYKPLPNGNVVDETTEKQLKEIFGVKGKGDLPNLAITYKILSTIEENLSQDKRYEDFLALCKHLAPTEGVPKRPLLAKFIYQFTARNTCDYFIHKDLGGFLKRELDFYIKNEVMRLDDIENADAPLVEKYLSKIKVIRKISTKLIEFLAQLEDFQKKLWLKKKFVVETNYCITLDRVPEELYPQIIKNQAQHDEWVKLFGIDEIKGTPRNVLGEGEEGYAKSLTLEFLKLNDKLVLDTRFFEESFKTKLIESIEDFDEKCDGLLIHSENFQALNLLQERYREQVKCVYIDPPYNTGKDGFPYKDNYQHSSWTTMIIERLKASYNLLNNSGAFFISIDEKEHHNLRHISDEIFGQSNLLADFVWLAEGNFDNQAKIKMAHEYILTYAIKELEFKHPPIVDPSITEKSKIFREEIRNTIVKNGPKNPISIIGIPVGFPASFEQGIIKVQDVNWPKYSKNIIVKEFRVQNEVNAKSGWSSKDLCEAYIKKGFSGIPDSKGQLTSFVLSNTGAIESVKIRSENQSYVTSIIKGVGTIQSTKSMLEHMDCSYPHYPKPIKLISYLLSMTGDINQIVLDFFGGSGTTGHAVINVNREEGGNRKFLLIEMGDHFDDVIKPRIIKVIYSSNWKDGKPIARNTGVSQCIKYLRLESYEDTLNNLEFDSATEDIKEKLEIGKSREKAHKGFGNLVDVRKDLLASNIPLREDYMLHYLLDVETRGSQSLLNINEFVDPTAYSLKIKKPGTDETVVKKVDLIETFNYLIGLRVIHLAAPQLFTAKFKRIEDLQAPKNQNTKLVVSGQINLVGASAKAGATTWWFRKIEGWVPADPNNPNNGINEKVLIVWRKLTGNIEEDNVMLDEWFKKYRISTKDFEFNTIYVNGTNNLPNLKLDNENWKVRLIEEEFQKRMWEAT